MTRAIVVRNTLYTVHERVGYVKADMKGVLGWSSVWAPSVGELLLRIIWALEGEQ